MSKFKVGDRVVGNENAFTHRVGKLGTVEHIDHMGNHLVTWDSGETRYIATSSINHHGQTLAELDVKPGDVVECVSHMYTNKNAYTAGGKYTVNLNNHVISNDGGGTGLCAKFRIISRAENKWNLCGSDYIEQDNHECTYHMGVPVSWREVKPKEVDVEHRVKFEYHSESMGCIYFHSSNSTLRGKTRNGKPVGRWTIDMDGDV